LCSFTFMNVDQFNLTTIKNICGFSQDYIDYYRLLYIIKKWCLQFHHVMYIKSLLSRTYTKTIVVVSIMLSGLPELSRTRGQEWKILRPTIFAAGFRYVIELRNSAHRPVGIGSPTAFTNSVSPAASDLKEDSLNRIRVRRYIPRQFSATYCVMFNVIGLPFCNLQT